MEKIIAGDGQNKTISSDVMVDYNAIRRWPVQWRQIIQMK